MKNEKDGIGGMSEEEVRKMIQRDQPFIDLDKTRALIRLKLDEDGDAELPPTIEAMLDSRWCVHRNGHTVTIRQREMFLPELWALAAEREAYVERLAADVDRQKRDIDLLRNIQ